MMRAKAWILSGAEFEIAFLPKITELFPTMPVIDGTDGVRFRMIEDHDHDDHDHDAGIDRHSWLGWEPAKIMAKHITDALCVINPQEEEKYLENYNNLIQEIDLEFDLLRKELLPLKGKNIFVYHPSFGYFLDEFDIHQIAVETGGKTPGPRDLNRLIALAKQEQPAAVFVQAQFPVSAAKTLADTVGAQLISLDPLAWNWLENIKLMGEALKQCIK